jgi:hypothetical protein
MKIVIRSAEKTDKDFVMSTWLKGNYWGSDYFKAMDQDEYFKEYGKNIQRLLDKPGTKVDAAVLEDAPDVVIGYIVYNDQALYWSYVKRDYRKNGILNSLFQNMDFVSFVGNTPVGLAIAKKKKLKFNPMKES